MIVNELEDDVRRFICFVCDGRGKHKKHLSRRIEKKFERRDILCFFFCLYLEFQIFEKSQVFLCKKELRCQILQLKFSNLTLKFHFIVFTKTSAFQ